MVISIIGILASFAVPAVFRAVETAKSTKMRMEISAIETALSRYEDKYGDRPPDFSSWAVINRHYRKIFPRISTAELNRLRLLTDVSTTNDVAIAAPATWPNHDATAMDRGEVLAWVLGGYSSNPINPFTGPGGPLSLVSSTATTIVYQVNIDRDNSLFDFDPARLDYSSINSAAAASLTNRYTTADGDLFLTYAAHNDGAPFVYFDSRTYALYDTPLSAFNGYGSTTYGVVRPYFSDLAVANTTGSDYASLGAALNAWQFVKPDSFQVIAPGVDGSFGSVATFEFDSSTSGAEPLYFQYPTGKAIAPSKATGVDTPGELIIPGVSRFQEAAKFGGVEDFQLDNLTNFSKAKIVDDLKE